MRINKKYDMGELARRVQAARSNAFGDRISVTGFDIDNVQSVLETCVDYPPDIPEIDRQRLIWQGISRAAEHNEIDAVRLEQSLRAAETEYLRQPLKQYVIASSLTIDYFGALRKTLIRDATITFTRSHPKRFSRTAIQKELQRATNIQNPERLTAIRIRVKARTDAAAIDQGLEAADLLRGIWNFWINAQTSMRHRIGPPKPINNILWGPVHTLHDHSGALVTGRYWVEPKHQQSDDLYRMTNTWEAVHRAEKKIRERMKGVRYAQNLQALFIRYGRALDVAEYDVAFNRLWGVFEHLAAAVGEYENLIRRTIFLYPKDEREFVRLILEHLRDVRNGLVHMDRSHHSMDTYLYQLKWFVEALFSFHMVKGREFSSLKTAGEFLSLPPDEAYLKQQVSHLRKAVHFQAREAGGFGTVG